MQLYISEHVGAALYYYLLINGCCILGTYLMHYLGIFLR